MSDNTQQIVRQLRDSLERLESELGSAPEGANIDESIRAANEIVRKLKGLRHTREERNARAHVSTPAPSQPEPDGDKVDPAAGLQKREYVVLALEEIGRPASPTFISGVIKHLWNADVPATQFASIRKGDERAWQRGRRTRPLVVPALNAFDLSARPRTCAISTWPAERRVMGQMSERADALHILLTAARRIGGNDGEAWRNAIKSIASDFHLGGPKREVEHMVEAAKDALSVVSDEDDRERLAAAERLRRLPDQRWQLFGRPMSYEVVEGGKNG